MEWLPQRYLQTVHLQNTIYLQLEISENQYIHHILQGKNFQSVQQAGRAIPQLACTVGFPQKEHDHICNPLHQYHHPQRPTFINNQPGTKVPKQKPRGHSDLGRHLPVVPPLWWRQIPPFEGTICQNLNHLLMPADRIHQHRARLTFKPNDILLKNLLGILLPPIPRM